MDEPDGWLRPADAGHQRLVDQHLSRSRLDDILDSLGAAPVGRQHEQGPTVGAAEHGREARAVEIDSLEHFTALADPDAVVGRARARGPDAALRIQVGVGPLPTSQLRCARANEVALALRQPVDNQLVAVLEEH
jgi:hypothetical protein